MSFRFSNASEPAIHGPRKRHILELRDLILQNSHLQGVLAAVYIADTCTAVLLLGRLWADAAVSREYGLTTRPLLG